MKKKTIYLYSGTFKRKDRWVKKPNFFGRLELKLIPLKFNIIYYVRLFIHKIMKIINQLSGWKVWKKGEESEVRR